MNVVSRRDVFRFSSLALAAPVVGALSMDGMSQTLAPNTLIDSKSNRPPYSKDLETYVNNGLTQVLNRANQHIDQSADWVQIASLSFFYARHLEASGVNAAYIKSISSTDPTTISLPHTTIEDLKSSLDKLKLEGLSGVIRKFSFAAKDHSRSSSLNSTTFNAMSGLPHNQKARYKSAVFYPELSVRRNDSGFVDNRFGDGPRLLRVVAPNCKGGQKLTPAQCQTRENELDAALALAAAWGCTKLGPAAYFCGGLLATIAALAKMLSDYCQGNPW